MHQNCLVLNFDLFQRLSTSETLISFLCQHQSKSEFQSFIFLQKRRTRIYFVELAKREEKKIFFHFFIQDLEKNVSTFWQILIVSLSAAHVRARAWRPTSCRLLRIKNFCRNFFKTSNLFFHLFIPEDYETLGRFSINQDI